MSLVTVHYLSMLRDGKVDIPDTAGPNSVYEDWTGSYTFSGLSVPNLYTVNWGDGSSTERVVMGGAISSVNTTSFNVTSPLMFDDPAPYQMAILSDNKTAYVTQPHAGAFHDNPVGRVSIVNLQTKKVLRNIEIPTPYFVWGIIATPDDKKVYVAASEVSGSDGQVFVIDTKSNKVTKRLDTGAYPSGLAISPDGTQLWVTCIDADQIWIFDTSDDSFVNDFNIGNQPARGVFSNAGDVFYLTCLDGDEIIAIDTDNHNTIDTITLASGSNPFGICKNADGSRLAVAFSGSSKVAIIGTSPFEVLGTVNVSSDPWDIDSDGVKAYATCNDGNVAIVNINTATLATSEFVGQNANGAVVSPDKTTAYITCYGWSDCDTQDDNFELTHNYPNPGTYTITATDPNGQVDVKGTVVVAVD